MEALDGGERLAEALVQISKLQASLESILGDKVGENHVNGSSKLCGGLLLLLRLLLPVVLMLSRYESTGILSWPFLATKKCGDVSSAGTSVSNSHSCRTIPF